MKPCNGCTACCTIMNIPELNKPACQRCEHEGDGCCTIYGDHPKSCKDFNCLWKQRHGTVFDDEKNRPDKINVVFSYQADATVAHVADVKHALSGRGGKIIEKIRKRGLKVVVLCRDDEPIILEPLGTRPV